MKILAIGAHPDDIEIGCVGTLLAFREKHSAEIVTLTLSSGEKSSVVEGAQDRQEEKQSAINLYDPEESHTGYLPDSEINLSDAIDIIEPFLYKILPDYIFTHYCEDTHQDHRIVSQATITACRRYKNLLFYQSLSTVNFNPTVFCDITSTLQRKLKILKAFTSQERKLNISQFAEVTAQYWSYRTGFEYVEAFNSEKLFL